MSPALLLPNNGTLEYRMPIRAGVATGTGLLRWRDGKFSGTQAALIEAATTNTTQNPILAANTNQWNRGPATTGVRDSTVGHDYATSFKVFQPVGTTLMVQTQISTLNSTGGIPFTGGDRLAASTWVRADSPIRLRIGVIFHDAGSGTNDMQRGPWVDVPGDGTWVELTNVFQSTAGTTRELWHFVEGDGLQVADTTVWLTESCYEPGKAQRSSFVPRYNPDGTLQDGYAWTGTANNSASTRIGTTVVLPFAETIGSIACWYSEDLGATWSFGYREGEGGIGLSADISDDGAGNLVISTATTLLLGPLAIFRDTLTALEQTDLADDTTPWTWARLGGSRIGLWVRIGNQMHAVR